MNARDFFRLVARMRESQRAYFKTRASVHLQASKRLERQVDEEISRVNAILERRDNPTLFD